MLLKLPRGKSFLAICGSWLPMEVLVPGDTFPRCQSLMVCCSLRGEMADRRRSVGDGIRYKLFHFLGHRGNNSNLLTTQNGVYWDAFGKSCILCDGFQMYKELPVIFCYSRSSGGFYRCKISCHIFLKTCSLGHSPCICQRCCITMTFPALVKILLC